jgi:hypothetical protein
MWMDLRLALDTKNSDFFVLNTKAAAFGHLGVYDTMKGYRTIRMMLK